MRDLKSPLLVPGVVAELVGLSPRALRRWARLVLGRRSARGVQLYSWADVEQLQQAADLVRRGRVPLEDVRVHLVRRPRPARTARRVVTRRKPDVLFATAEPGPSGRGALVSLRGPAGTRRDGTGAAGTRPRRRGVLARAAGTGRRSVVAGRLPLSADRRVAGRQARVWAAGSETRGASASSAQV